MNNFLIIIKKIYVICKCIMNENLLYKINNE